MQPHLDWLAIGALLAFSGRAAYEDLRSGRIPNRLLQGMMLAIALWFWVLLVAVGFLDTDAALIRPSSSLPAYFLEVGRNGLVAFGIAMALWFGRLWAAGDAKLFPLVVLLLPLRVYSRAYVALFPGFVLLYNFVVATFAVIAGDLVWRLVQYVRGRPAGSFLRGTLAALRGAPAYAKANAADWGRFLLVLLVTLVFIKTVRHFLREALSIVLPLDETIAYVVLFFACHPLIQFMRHRWVLVAGVSVSLTAIGVAAFTTWVPGLSLLGLLTMSAVALVLMTFRMIYDAYLARIDYIEIEVEAIRPKMILSDVLMERIRRDKAFFREQKLELGALLADGLDAEQVPIVQRWIREKAPGERVHIQKTFPMGACIFLGVLFTLVANGYLFEIPR